MTLFDGAGPMPITLEAQVEVARREIRFREYVYPRRVRDGKMAQSEADQQLAGMKAIHRTLRGLLESGEQAPEAARFPPGELTKLQTQAAQGVMLKRLATAAMKRLDQENEKVMSIVVDEIQELDALREALKSMEKP